MTGADRQADDAAGSEPSANDSSADPALDALPADRPVVLFDGVCNLCNGAVQFLLAHDEAGRLRFAPLQSAVGQAVLREFDLPADDTFVLVEDGTAYTRSTAAVRVARHLDGPWSRLAAVRYVPRPLRDLGYRLVARSRYRLFGRRDRCMVPSPSVRDRFLDGADAAADED